MTPKETAVSVDEVLAVWCWDCLADEGEPCIRTTHPWDGTPQHFPPERYHVGRLHQAHHRRVSEWAYHDRLPDLLDELRWYVTAWADRGHVDPWEYRMACSVAVMARERSRRKAAHDR